MSDIVPGGTGRWPVSRNVSVTLSLLEYPLSFSSMIVNQSGGATEACPPRQDRFCDPICPMDSQHCSLPLHAFFMETDMPAVTYCSAPPAAIASNVSFS